MNTEQREEMKADYDLQFSKSGDNEWTSLNNNYVICKAGPRKFEIFHLGMSVTDERNLKAAMKTAADDQVDRLYGE